VLHRPQQEEDETPTARRSAFAETGSPASPQDAAYLEEPAPAPSLWQQIPRATVRDPEPEPEPSVTSRANAIGQRQWENPAERDDEPDGSISIGERADADAHPVTLTPRAVSGYRLPPSTLLHRSDDQQIIREDELREEAKVLVEKCAEFDVTGQVTQINPGPVVTTFEFRPEAGVKYSRVTGLADDLCLAMAAESILIERMAGKSTVGIQVPNSTRETIWLRDVVEDPTFAQTKFKLPLAMGKDINGRIVVADLATMPHVLIAGSTGSGKSVAINAMIMSVLFKTTPEQVRMILVDPKRVELGMYEGIPHLFTPIITEPKLAANALRNAVREMERRLKLLASRSVRNIDQYNKLFDAGTPSMFEDAEEQTPLPYILIIIDELADLMMLDRANVEEAITRLAQMARAVGIHLVLATQRPSVDVITGLIKANVPTRISFRLATKVDSRTILDNNGAEALLGRGDMLFLPPGTSRLQRVHAPFVTETEISAVVDFWKAQGGAEYVEAFLESPRDEKGRELNNEDGEEDDDDPLFNDAVRLVFEFGKASTSLIQRRLRVGYGRAAHLIDMMERDGLVGPADGSKPREILKSPDWLTEIESSTR
jgi:S-DNA-T family DNA segregation ATPase FtsK/SpoIIIE